MASEELRWRWQNVLAGARGSGWNGRLNACAVPSTTDTHTANVPQAVGLYFLAS